MLAPLEVEHQFEPKQLRSGLLTGLACDTTMNVQRFRECRFFLLKLAVHVLILNSYGCFYQYFIAQARRSPGLPRQNLNTPKTQEQS